MIGWFFLEIILSELENGEKNNLCGIQKVQMEFKKIQIKKEKKAIISQFCRKKSKLHKKLSKEN